MKFLLKPFFWQKCSIHAKVGKSAGVAMAAGLSRQIPVTEYSPKKIKMAITGMATLQRNKWPKCYKIYLVLKNYLKI